MPFEFRSGGKSVDIEDIPLDVYVKIEAETEIPWYRLTSAPARYAKAGSLLAKACADHLGVECPTLTPKSLVTMFELVEEPNTPTQYEDGMPDPKAADTGQATG